MTVNKTGGGAPTNAVQPRPAEPPRVDTAPQQGQGQPTGTPRNAARPLARGPSDGFETLTAGQRSQRQALLGATPTPPPVAPQQQGVLEKLGLTPQDLIQAGTIAAPHLESAAQAAVQGQWPEALGFLADAARASPQIAEKAIRGLAQNLPAGPMRTLLTNEQVVHELLTNRELHGSIGKLIQNPTDLSAVRELLGNDSLREPVLSALGSDPAISQRLQQVGLSTSDLLSAGRAAPRLWDAFEKLSNGDVRGGLTDFQAAVQAAPDLAARVGQRLLDKVPQQLRDQLAQMGINAQSLQTAAPALPHLYEAADAAVNRDWQRALNSLQQAAGAAPQLVQQAIQGLAQQLPPQLGAVRTLLTDQGFVRELVNNTALREQVGKLFNESTRMEGLRGLLGNDSARDAALRALGNDPAISQRLQQVGLSAEDLRSAGRAAPRLWDAFEKLSNGDVRGGLTDFQAAVQAAPDLAARVGQNLLDKVPQQLRDQLAQMGINAQSLRTAAPALPHLYEAADAAVNRDWQRAFNSIRQAAGAAPALATQMLKGLAGQLPPQMGVARSLLTNDAFLTQLVTNRSLQDSIGKLIGGDTSALRELLNNDAARDTALAAIGNDPAIQQRLQGLGLTPRDLVDAGRAAPRLLEAFEKLKAGNVREALADFQAAVQAAPQLAARLGEQLVAQLPPQVKQQLAQLGINEQNLRSAVPALPHLLDAAQAVGVGNWQGALNSVREAAIAAPQLATQMLGSLASQLPPQMGALRTLLTNNNFLTELVRNRSVHEQVGKLFNDATRMEGLRGLLGNDSVRDAALAALGSDPGVQSTLRGMGLTPADLVDAGRAAPHLMDAMQAFTDGRIEEGAAALGRAAEAAPALLDKIGQKVLAQLPANVRNAINGLGLTPSELAQAARALPDLIRAGQAISGNDPQGALQHLRNAAGKIPSSIVEKALTGMASQLPQTGFAGMARSLLTNPDFVRELVNNPSLHASFDKMMQGDFVTGMREILGNGAVRDAAANALATNREIMDRLRPFGIQSGADISALGSSVFDVLDAAGHLGANPPNPQEALRSLSKAVGNLPPDLRARMVGAFADRAGLPAWAKDTLVAAAGLIGNEAVGQSMGQALDALRRGDVAGFAAGLAATGRTIAQTSPEVAKAFLNSLSRIPGSVGRLFADPQLNAAMVDSGAAANMFNAFERLARGDIGGALNEIASAAGNLLGHGQHFNVAGVELPFGQQGIENFTRLFGRFVDALPESLKARITEAAARFAARAGLKSIPLIGNVVSGISSLGSLKDLVNAMREQPRDPVKIALAAGQLGLDVAGVVPGLNSITGPLQAVLGTATVIKGATDLIGDLRQFQQGLLGM